MGGVSQLGTQQVLFLFIFRSTKIDIQARYTRNSSHWCRCWKAFYARWLLQRGLRIIFDSIDLTSRTFEGVGDDVVPLRSNHIAVILLPP